MSLITLSSELNAQDPRPQNASYIKNHFKDGITFHVGDTISLVSLTINKQDRFEIVQGSNDTLVWRIGAAAYYEQHSVVVPEGSYTGTELASALASALQASTIIGVFQYQVDGTGEQIAGWTCVFNQTDAKGFPTFTIDITQQAPPASAGASPNNPFSLYAGGQFAMDIENAQPSTFTTFTSNISDSSDMDTQNVGDRLFAAERGIFGNGGSFVMEIPCLTGMNTDVGEFQGLLGSTGPPVNQMDFTDYTAGAAVVRTGYFEVAAPTAAGNGWDLQFTFEDDGEVRYVRIITGEEDFLDGPGMDNGAFGWGTDENDDATEQASYDAVPNYMYFNETDGTLQDEGRKSTDDFDYNIERTDGTAITNSMDLPIGFPETRMGYCRQQLYNGATDYPGNADAIANPDLNGTDFWFILNNNPTTNSVYFQAFQLKQQQGTQFPNGNWRAGNQEKMRVLPSAFDQLDPLTAGGAAPANWTQFDIANKPTIRLVLSLDSLRTLTCSVAHDTDGTGTFTEYRDLLKSGTTQNVNFVSTIKESFYPLRPIMCCGRGGFYSAASYVGKTISDDKEYTRGLGVSTPMMATEDTHTLAQVAEADAEQVQADPPNALALSQMWKLGTILPEDLTSAGGNFPDADLNPNTADLNTTLGTARYEVFAAGSVHNPVITFRKPITAILEPSLSVELQDFNLGGYNGFTGDKNKAIAIIPKEELQTGENEGVLHYYSQFPIDIDLKVPQTQTLYSLTAALRLKDGTLANDLLNPTEMTLLHKEGEESKQARIMAKALERISGYRSDIQQNEISTIGNQFPRV